VELSIPPQVFLHKPGKVTLSDPTPHYGGRAEESASFTLTLHVRMTFSRRDDIMLYILSLEHNLHF